MLPICSVCKTAFIDSEELLVIPNLGFSILTPFRTQIEEWDLKIGKSLFSK